MASNVVTSVGKNSQWQKEKEYIRFYNSILEKVIREHN